MRCQFCGWDNPQGKSTCEKCNKPLAVSVSGSDSVEAASVPVNHSRPTDRQPISVSNLKATVREKPAGQQQPAAGTEENKCPDCGYTLENGVCASCGYDVAHVADKPVSINRVVTDGYKTVRPMRKNEKKERFTLTPISEESGTPEGEAMSYEGGEIGLNRENTSPGNSTITSVCQALVRCEDGKWTIEDRSEYKTTFVQATRKIELKKGDLILLGNQLYRFDA